MIGRTLGRYKITSLLGKGGMGEVYRARDTSLDRDVAIKILPVEFAQRHERRMRFEREAKTISNLSHPRICTLHDFGYHDGTPYLVMELLEGETLAERVSRGPLSVEDALRWGAEIAEALDCAHTRGIVHRDLKPGNVMLTATGLKLLDFGLAKETAAMPGQGGISELGRQARDKTCLMRKPLLQAAEPIEPRHPHRGRPLPMPATSRNRASV